MSTSAKIYVGTHTKAMKPDGSPCVQVECTFDPGMHIKDTIKLVRVLEKVTNALTTFPPEKLIRLQHIIEELDKGDK